MVAIEDVSLEDILRRELSNYTDAECAEENNTVILNKNHGRAGSITYVLNFEIIIKKKDTMIEEKNHDPNTKQVYVNEVAELPAEKEAAKSIERKELPQELSEIPKNKYANVDITPTANKKIMPIILLSRICL